MPHRADFSVLKDRIENCGMCSLSKTRKHALPGEGNRQARIMLVAQAPGEKEDERGRMFVGPTGRVLDEILWELGLERNNFYLTNLIKCMLPDYRKPKSKEIEACSGYLDREIELLNPGIISPLGYYSTKYICNKYRYTVPDKKGVESLYGRLLLANGQKIYPLIHPTALVFDTSDKEKIRTGYAKLKVLLYECKWYYVCPMKRFFQAGILESKWVELYCRGDWESCIRYKMEEEGRSHPDSMLPDGSIDERLKGK